MSKNPDEIKSVDNLYRDIFNIDPPGVTTWEIYTSDVLWDLENENFKAINSRMGAVCHLIRSMVQGNQLFPQERFEEVVGMAIASMRQIHSSIDEKTAKLWIRNEMKEVWEPYDLQDEEQFKRAQEVHRLVSGPTRHFITKLGMIGVRKAVKTLAPVSPNGC